METKRNHGMSLIQKTLGLECKHSVSWPASVQRDICAARGQKHYSSWDVPHSAPLPLTKQMSSTVGNSDQKSLDVTREHNVTSSLRSEELKACMEPGAG